VRAILRLAGQDEALIRYVPDRPGHDRRYAMNSTKIREALGWKPRHVFEDGLEKTVAWYRDNKTWTERVRSGAYRAYYEQQYAARLAAGAKK
jgi:dTDP-glucose 4,6-dehydratase